jgi:hypothetical protein
VNEDEERAILERFTTAFGKQVTGRETEGMARVAKRLRLIADQRVAFCRATDAAQVFAVVAEQGSGLAQSDDEVAVLAKCGWLGMNRAVLTVRRGTSAEDANRVELLVRAAALEGKISQRGARRLLDEIAGLIAPYLTTPLQSVPS